jgi:hypothetical protein
MQPFKTGMKVTGNEFFGRQVELSRLREFMQSSGRVYVVGERRIGKTSLIFEAIRPLKKMPFVYVDLFAVKTVSDVTHRLALGVGKAKTARAHILSLLAAFTSLRPSLAVDPVTQAPTLTFAPGTGDSPETLDEIFGIIDRWPAAVVVFDEFQDILALREAETVIAHLRSLVQLREKTCFVFCGSIRSQMEAIFTDEEAPFFNSAMRLFVGPMEKGVLEKMVRKKLASGKRRISAELLGGILETCHCNPGDVQRYCTALWQVTSYDSDIAKGEMGEALNMLFAMQQEKYEVIMLALSPQQAQALRALAIVGGESNLSKAFIEQTGISLMPSVEKALRGLIDKRIVYKIDTRYRFCDPFLAAWLRRQPA